MMPIDGSVHDVHTILGVEEHYFPPDFKEYILKERLYWWQFFGWVFWSHQTQKDTFAEKIKDAVQKLLVKMALDCGSKKKELDGCLFQFWAATKTSEGRTLLTTQFQPFALRPTSYHSVVRHMLCSYGMGMCREYNNSFYADAECAQELLGLPGRVFLNQLPESTTDVKYYTLKEYPQRDLALRCEIGSSSVLPVFDHSGHTCVGVLEIVCHGFFAHSSHNYFVGQMNDIFQEVGLQCFDGYKHYELQIGDENIAFTTAFQELKTVLETVCKIHKLPLAMTWVPCSACNYLLRGKLLSEGVEFFQCSNTFQDKFIEFSKCSHLTTGVVAGMVLSSSNILYCSDITQLSLVEYPLVPYARHCQFRGWFTICLQSSYTANDIYVLEFFLPSSSNNSWTSILSLILGTMEENFKTFKLASGQELGDLLSVEVIDFQNGEKLHFIQKMHIMLSIDQSRNAHNVVIAERNILVVPSSKERKRKMQDRKHKKAGVKIEVSLEEILKCSNMKRKYAARELKVSVATLKRVCRDYHIRRWPPRNIENANPFQPSPVENQRQIPRLNSDLPSNQALVGVSHIKPGFQDANMVTIRAKYEKNIIKFRLLLPSRFVELQEEVAKRLNLEAGTYDVKYKDEEDELILIACDEDLQDCMHTSSSLGKTSVVVLLELKQPITNLNPGLSGGQQTLFSPLCRQGLQSAEGELSNVPPVHNTGGVWLDAHFSYTPTIEEEETINKCMQDGSFRGEFVDGCWISNTTVIEYSEMLDYYLSHCHFFCPNVIKNFKQNGRLLNTILPKTEKIFFPILRERHWMLLVIDVKKKCFLWLDSMRCETEKKYSEDFAHFLNHEFVFKRLREQNEWPIKYPENTPKQENGNDCGVYMMAFMISLAVGDKLHQLSQAQVQKMRRTICLELKKRDIIPRCPLVDNKFLCIQERKKNEANEKLRKESTAASRDEVFIVSERRKHVKSVDQVPSESSQIPPHQSSSSDLQPLTSQNKNKAQVQTARKQNWSKEEDEALCKAWLRVSEDAANGTDQARAKLWDRVRAEFNNILGYETGRISKGLMHRWAIIQQHVNKYSSSERSIERNPTSGCNAEQSIEAAKDLYYRTNGHQFKWYGCWLILKDTSKWFHHMKEQEGREEKIAQRKKREGTLDVDEIVFPSNPSTPVTPSSVGAPISLDDNISPLNDGPTDLLRPTGRKETKNPRRMKKGDQSEGVNFILSEFSNMRKEQKELVQQEISMAAERERMKIQAKLELERMKIAAKREQDQINFEREIMLKDPSTVTTEEGRAWVIAQQKAIWARVNRGGGIGDGSSGNV